MSKPSRTSNPRRILNVIKKRVSSSFQSTGYEADSECSADWYDEAFMRDPSWRQHYTASRYYALWSVIADRMTRYNVRSVLDIGCGPGQVATLLHDIGIPKYVGIDFSSERIEQARKICPEYKFVLADVFETDLLREHKYDCVLCTEFLEHVDKDTEVLKRLKTDSRFLGSVPNFPYKSHVRYFVNPEQIYERYSLFFKDLEVKVIVANTQGRKYFLMDGEIR